MANEYRLDHLEVDDNGDGDWYDELRMECLSGVTGGERHSVVRRAGETGERMGVRSVGRVGVEGIDALALLAA